MITCQMAVDDPQTRDELEELLELLSRCLVLAEFLIDDMPPFYGELNQIYSFISDSFFMLDGIRNSLDEEE